MSAYTGHNMKLKKVEKLGAVYSPYTLKEVEKIRSPLHRFNLRFRTSGLVGVQNDVLAVTDYDESKWID